MKYKHRICDVLRSCRYIEFPLNPVLMAMTCRIETAVMHSTSILSINFRYSRCGFDASASFIGGYTANGFLWNSLRCRSVVGLPCIWIRLSFFPENSFLLLFTVAWRFEIFLLIIRLSHVLFFLMSGAYNYLKIIMN